MKRDMKKKDEKKNRDEVMKKTTKRKTTKRRQPEHISALKPQEPNKETRRISLNKYNNPRPVPKISTATQNYTREARRRDVCWVLS